MYNKIIGILRLLFSKELVKQKIDCVVSKDDASSVKIQTPERSFCMKESKNKNNHQSEEQQNHQNKSHTEHQHHEKMLENFKKRFWFSLILTMPILILSPLIQNIFGYELTFRFDRFVLFGLSSLVYFYGGWPFLTGLIDELKKKQPGMMTLIGVAITVAYGYSAAITFGLEGKTFYWELATLIDIMLLGHWIEMKSVMGASNALQQLVQLMPSEAHLVEAGKTKDVAIDQLKQGDQVFVKPGEKIPVDGIITDGETHVDESMVTGESKPVKKEADNKVIGGTINGNGSLTIKVEQVGDEAYLNKVINMVKEAQSEKSKTQHLADKVAFFPFSRIYYFGYLAVFGTTFCFCLRAHGQCDGYYLSACPGFGHSFGRSYFYFGICPEGTADS